MRNKRESNLVDENKIVWVTAGADCYHEENCRHITSSLNPKVDLPKREGIKVGI